MGLYKLKKNAGSHSDGERTYVAGDVVESARDLAEAWPHKFEKVLDIPSDAVADAPLEIPEPQKRAGTVDVAEDEELSGVVSRLGKNVTADFPTAAAAGLIVLQRGTKFRLADPDMPDRALGKGVPADEIAAKIAEIADKDV